MKQIVATIAAFAETIGAPGLFIIAFLDSSFLSFPQGNDLLLIWMVLRNPGLMPVYAAAATLGSIAGCLVLHHLAAKGGEAFLRKRVKAGHVDRAMRLIQRFGVLAVLVPSILPPPAPFKLFVLLSGVAGVPRGKFALAIALGRGFRYFGQGILAVWYGEAAIEFLRTHGRELSFALVGALVVAGVGFYAWRRFRHRAAPAAI